MRANFLGLFVLFGTIVCCEKNTFQNNMDGHYTGTFNRGGISSYVELTLGDHSFSGESDTVKFPAICNGLYSISDKKITFENQCVWTAEFDWSLILSDSWNFNFVDNELTLTNSIGDVYRLKR
jgi:hypothetical protein